MPTTTSHSGPLARPVVLLLHSHSNNPRVQSAKSALTDPATWATTLRPGLPGDKYQVHVLSRKDLLPPGASTDTGSNPAALVNALQSRVDQDWAKRVAAAAKAAPTPRSHIGSPTPRTHGGSGSKDRNRDVVDPPGLGRDVYLLEGFPWSLAEVEALMSHSNRLGHEGHICLDGVVSLTDEPGYLPFVAYPPSSTLANTTPSEPSTPSTATTPVQIPFDAMSPPTESEAAQAKEQRPPSSQQKAPGGRRPSVGIATTTNIIPHLDRIKSPPRTTSAPKEQKWAPPVRTRAFEPTPRLSLSPSTRLDPLTAEEESYVDNDSVAQQPVVVPPPQETPPPVVEAPAPTPRDKGGKKEMTPREPPSPTPTPTPAPVPVPDPPKASMTPKTRFNLRSLIEKKRAFRRQDHQGWDALDFLDLSVVSTEPPFLIRCVHAWACNKGEDREEFAKWRKYNQQTTARKLPLSQNMGVIKAAMEAAGGVYGGAWDENPVLRRYRRASSQIPETVVTPANLLSAMLQALDDNKEAAEENYLARKKGQGANHRLGPGKVWIQYGDEAAKRLARAEMRLPEGGNLKDVDSQLAVAIERAFSKLLRPSTIVGTNKLPQERRQTLPEVAVDSTEMLSFSRLAAADMHSERQVLAFEELVNSIFSDTPKWDWKFDDRVYRERLASHVLRQVLAKETLRAPALSYHYRYYEPTDSLLLVTFQPTAAGRKGVRVSRASRAVRCPLDFLQWSQQGLRGGEPEKGVLWDTNLEAISSADLVQTVLYPSDHAIISHWKPCNYVSVYKDDHTFGIVPTTHSNPTPKDNRSLFYAGLEDGARVVVRSGPSYPKKPDKHDSALLSYSLPTGLITTVGSDGSIRMEYTCVTGKEMSAPPSGRLETCRIVKNSGLVVRYLRSGAIQVLFSDGTVADRPSIHSPHFIYTKPDGTRCLSSLPVETPKGHAGENHMSFPAPDIKPLSSRCDFDPISKALVRLCANGVLVVEYPNGDVWARHADGTSFRTTADKEKLLVEAPGYAHVEYDVPVDQAASKHAQGFQIPIKKGGDRVRSRIAIPDGTRLTANYDTRVIATVCGKVTALLPDMTEIIAFDDQRVLLKPRQSYGKNQVGVEGESSGLLEGTYVFDNRQGVLNLVDHHHNIFAVPLGGQATVELAGESEGVKAKAVIDDMVNPRLFIIERDGSGTELLRLEDVKEYQERVLRRERVTTQQMVEKRSGAQDDRPCELITFHTRELNYQQHERLFEIVFGSEDFKVWAGCYQIPQLAKTWMGELPKPNPLRTSFVLTRTWEQRPSFLEVDRSAMLSSLQVWDGFKKQRELDVDRFKLEDPRDQASLEEEVAMVKELKKLYRAAKVARRKDRELARQKAEEAGSPLPEADALNHHEDEDDHFADESDQEPEEEEADVELEEDLAAYETYDNENKGYLDPEGLRLALIQVLHRFITVDQAVEFMNAEMFRTFEEPDKISFSDFHRIASRLRSEDEQEVEDLSSSQQPERDHVVHRADIRSPPHGLFWSTSEGRLAKDMIQAPASRKKGDLVYPSEVPIPERSGSSCRNPQTEDTNTLTSSSALLETVHTDTSATHSPGHSYKGPEVDVLDSVDGAGSLLEMHRMTPKQLEYIASGSGRNAARARAILRWENGDRLEWDGRPADNDVYGHPRAHPVRMRDARVPTNVKVIIPQGPVGKREGLFGVYPQALDLGSIEAGKPSRGQVRLTNTGDVPSRCRCGVKEESQMGAIKLPLKPVGVIAPGMSSLLEVELQPVKEGPLTGLIQVTTATETFTIGVSAKVVAAPKE